MVKGIVPCNIHVKLIINARMNTLQVKNKAKLVSCLESKRHIPHQVCEVIIRLATDDLIPSTVSDVVSIEKC